MYVVSVMIIFIWTRHQVSVRLVSRLILLVVSCVIVQHVHHVFLDFLLLMDLVLSVVVTALSVLMVLLMCVVHVKMGIF